MTMFSSATAVLNGQSHNRFGIPSVSQDSEVVIQIATPSISPALMPFYSLFRIDVSEDLRGWQLLRQMLVENDVATSGTIDVVDSARSLPRNRFYRVQMPQLITPFAQATGSFRVGTLSLLVTDPDRRSNTLPGEDHQIVITIWYPAQEQAGTVPEKYVETAIAFNWELYRDGGAIVDEFVSHSDRDAPIRSGAFPIIIYSPGLWGHRKSNTGLAVELASHGYIVVGIDHEDSELSLHPDGRQVEGTHPPNTTAANTETIQQRAQDIVQVLDTLGELNETHPVLSGKLELSAIGGIGFSLGGSAILKACSQDDRLLTVCAMDGGLFDEVLRVTTLGKPLLFVRGDGADPEYGGDDRKSFFDLQVAPAWWLKFRQAMHVSFIDAQLIGVFPPISRDTGREIHRVRNRYVLSFFNRFVKKEDDGLLDAEPEDSIIRTLVAK